MKRRIRKHERAKPSITSLPIDGEIDELIPEGIELRCAACINIDCECPGGYETSTITCQICSHEFILLRPLCLKEAVSCPECNGPAWNTEGVE